MLERKGYRVMRSGTHGFPMVEGAVMMTTWESRWVSVGGIDNFCGIGGSVTDD